MSEQFDLIVIGAGSAARDGAQKATREYGANVALVERTRWGGSCPNVACKPTKAYLVVADLLHEINTIAARLGIEVSPARADMAKIKARKDSLMKSQEKWVEDLNAAGLATFDGEATLVDAHTARVGDEDLRADRILIATGSRTAVPPVDGIDGVDWIDHVSALELTELPAGRYTLSVSKTDPNTVWAGTDVGMVWMTSNAKSSPTMPTWTQVGGLPTQWVSRMQYFRRRFAAQMAGCPVAAYRRGAMPEVVEDGVSGFLADPDDAVALAIAIRRCLALDRDAVRASALRRLGLDAALDGYEAALERASR